MNSSVEYGAGTSSSNYEMATDCGTLEAPSATSIELSKIDAILELNKSTNEKYMSLEKVLMARLHECRQKINDNINGIITLTNKTDTFRYYVCGKPYFKDKNYYQAPDNEDTILMRQAEMYDFSQILSHPGWTVKDKSQFITLIKKMSQEIQIEKIQSKISHLKRENKNIEENKVVKKLIASYNKEISKMGNKPLEEIALPIDVEYDWENIAHELNYRHTPEEYQSLWKLFYHPSINKSTWNRAEHIELQKIAGQHKFQDWDQIAAELGTGRTGYQCFVYFRTNMTDTSAGRKWTKAEVVYLKRVIQHFREDNYIPWGKVAAAMKNRTKIQIYNKYLRLIERRKGRFLEEEDAVILNCAAKFGPNFKVMSSFLPCRSVTQLRSRYNVLSKMRISIVWTVEDDKKLIQMMANEESDSNYSEITKHFPGKDRTHIRTRYLTLKKWMRRQPHNDLSKAPRRGSRRLIHGQATDNLSKAVENLKLRMKSVYENTKSKKLTKHSPEEDIDNALINICLSEIVKEDRLKPDTEDAPLSPNNQALESAETLNTTCLKKLLNFLNSKLDKNLYQKSIYSEQIPDLAEQLKEVSQYKVKSYSKKNQVKTISVNNIPDIWGTKTLGSLNHVLPPNYATITGCKVVMKHITATYTKSKDASHINLNITTRRNAVLHEQFILLKERFTTLFLWPMLLSNEEPKIDVNSKKNLKLIRAMAACDENHKQVIPMTPSIAIPVINKKIYKELNEADGNINLREEENRESVSITNLMSHNIIYELME